MSTGQSVKIPWWGTRKYARSLAVEKDKLGHDLAVERVKTEKLAEIAQNLLKDAKDIQRENGQLKSQMEELRLLSVVELEAKRSQLQREVLHQCDRWPPRRNDVLQVRHQRQAPRL